ATELTQGSQGFRSQPGRVPSPKRRSDPGPPSRRRKAPAAAAGPAWSPAVWILLLAGAAAFAFVLLGGVLAPLWWFRPAPPPTPFAPAAANSQQAGERGTPNPGTEKAGNLLVNGSFEEGPDPGPGRFLTLNEGSTEIRGWVVTRGQIDYNGTYWEAADGQRSL